METKPSRYFCHIISKNIVIYTGGPSPKPPVCCLPEKFRRRAFPVEILEPIGEHNLGGGSGSGGGLGLGSGITDVAPGVALHLTGRGGEVARHHGAEV